MYFASQKFRVTPGKTKSKTLHIAYNTCINIKATQIDSIYTYFQLMIGGGGGEQGGSRSTTSLTSPSASRIFLPCCLPTPAFVPLTWLYCYIRPLDVDLIDLSKVPTAILQEVQKHWGERAVTNGAHNNYLLLSERKLPFEILPFFSKNVYISISNSYFLDNRWVFS